jgi:hypothetical protein
VADLTNADKRKLEKLFEMGGGYLLNFSNRTFEEFVFDSTGRAIDDAKYQQGSGSKANRLRAFWSLEPDHVVGKLVADLIDYRETDYVTPADRDLVDYCRGVAQRLLSEAPVIDLNAIAPTSDAREFDLLARAVRDSIERNEPVAGLDRLHTFMVHFVRGLAEARGITVDRSKPLHAILGEYVKSLRAAALVRSDMADRILRSAISTLDAFNHVRNELSLAHPNPLLGYDESLLILNHVASVVRFVRSIEQPARRAAKPPTQEATSDVPF